jgi:membrane associated rhomboid family serine protease
VIPLRDANPTRRPPLVTLGLIGACFVVFAYELGLQADGGDRALLRFYLDYGVVPARLTRALDAGDFLSPAVLAIVTSMFIHGGWLHLLGNMLYLWIFGDNVEDRLGRVAYLVFYLVGGVVAALTQWAIDPTSQVPLVGASGAIAAVLGAYLVLFPGARVLSLVLVGFFYQLVAVPALLVLGFWFLLQLLNGALSLGMPSAGGGVAFFAHIGGFVAGAILALPYRGRRPARPWSVG